MGEVGEGSGNPLRYLCLKKSPGRRSLECRSLWGRQELDRTERLKQQTNLGGGKLIRTEEGVAPSGTGGLTSLTWTTGTERDGAWSPKARAAHPTWFSVSGYSTPFYNPKMPLCHVCCRC